MNLASLVDQHPAGDRALYAEGVWHTWGEVRRRAAAVAAALTSSASVPKIGWRSSGPPRSISSSPISESWRRGRWPYRSTPTAPPTSWDASSPPSSRSWSLPTARSAPSRACPTWCCPSRWWWPNVCPASLGPGRNSRPSPPRALTPARPPGPDTDAGTDDGHRLHPVEREESDVAVLLFTSGTAGEPKAAMLSHGNLVANLHQMLGIPEILRADDVGLVALPLFHIFGLNVALGLSLATGAALVLDTRFDAAQSIQQVHDLGVTTLLGVPTMFAAWADMPETGAGARRHSPVCVGRSPARPPSTPMSPCGSNVATGSRSGRGMGSPRPPRRCRRRWAPVAIAPGRSVAPCPVSRCNWSTTRTPRSSKVIPGRSGSGATTSS